MAKSNVFYKEKPLVLKLLHRFCSSSSSCLGLDLDYHSIKLIELSFFQQHYRVLACGSFDFPTKLDPLLENLEPLVHALKIILRETIFTSKEVVFSLMDSMILQNNLQISVDLSDLEREEAVNMAVEHYMDCDQDPLNVDFEVRHASDHKATHVEIQIIAARRSLITRLTHALRSCGLKAHIIEPRSHAMARFFSFMHRMDQHTTAVIDVTCSDLKIYVLRAHDCIFYHDDFFEYTQDYDFMLQRIYRMLQLFDLNHPEHALHKIILIGSFLKDDHFIAWISAHLSVSVDVAYSFLHLDAALRHPSEWMAAYGLALAMLTSGVHAK